jgi:hypothetical protein
MINDELTSKCVEGRDVQDSELGTLTPDEYPEGGFRAWSCVAGACVAISTVSLVF